MSTSRPSHSLPHLGSAPGRSRPCTATLHGRISADPERWAAETANHRPWPEAGLELGEHDCGSTLARVVAS